MDWHDRIMIDEDDMFSEVLYAIHMDHEVVPVCMQDYDFNDYDTSKFFQIGGKWIAFDNQQKALNFISEMKRAF